MGQLYAVTPFSMLDYPGEMSCIAWFAGCNMRCVYCHNPDIVTGKGQLTEESLYAFLNARTGRLGAVVFSGGEPTLCADLPVIMRKVKEMGFKVKLDTNGSRPEVLRYLLAEGLLDYVAMDYKAPLDKVESLIGATKLWPLFHESLALLVEAARSGRPAFEVRTTFHADLLSDDDLNSMIADLDAAGFAGTYYIQNIASTGDKTIGGIEAPIRELNRENLTQPKGFKLGFRNFKEPPQKG